MKKLIVLTLLAPFAANAAEIPTPSVITAATVFPTRADISRNAEVSLPQGKHTIVFDGLPAALDTKSLRISGTGAFLIGSIEIKELFSKDFVVEQERKLRGKIADLSDKRRFVESELTAAETGKTFLENMAKSNAVPQVSVNGKKDALSPDAWGKAWQSLQNGMKSLGRETIEKQIEIRKIDAELSALNKELRLLSDGAKSAKQIRVNVEASAPAAAKLTVQYQIANASWKPTYEARLNTRNKTVEIMQYGTISQHTGEEWRNIDLTFSTARPIIGTVPPELETRWLNLDEPVKKRGKMLERGVAVYRNDSSFADTMDEPSGTAEIAAAEFSGSDFAGTFAVKGKANVPSDGSEHRFLVGGWSAKADIYAQTVPAIQPAAYVMASTQLNAPAPLLPGTMSLFRDGAFIGDSEMNFLRPNAKLHLSFGQDDKILVKHTIADFEEDNGGRISRNNKITIRTAAAVQNLHKEPLKIAVYDFLPVARNSDIAVKITKDKTTAGYETDPDGKVGVIKWESVYQPQEQKTVDYGYTITYPKDRELLF